MSLATGFARGVEFADFDLTPHLFKRLSERGFKSATSIQSECFEMVKQGASVLGCSKTGSGKTLAYVLPLLTRHSRQEATRRVEGILYWVMVPTRELAAQVFGELKDFLEDPSDVACFVGGESEESQLSSASKAQWVVATPGRLLDFLKRDCLKCAENPVVVFDEADRLLDMGFIDDMRAILKMLSRPSQLLFFSATVNLGVEELAYEFGAGELLRVGQSQDEVNLDLLRNTVAFVGEDEKFHALVSFLKSQENARGIVFSNYREKAGMIARRLHGLGLKSEALTAQLAQNQRTRIMQEFREQRIRVLVASDLAARGIDVVDLDFVVNFDLPEDPATYVHRVGRTARAGRSGIALSLVGFDDAFHFERLEKFLNRKMDRVVFDEQQLKGPLKGWLKEQRSVRASEGGQSFRDSGARQQRSSQARYESQPRKDSPVQQRSSGPQGQSAVLRAPPQSPSQLLAQQGRGSVWLRVKTWLRGLFAPVKATPAPDARKGFRDAASVPDSASGRRRSFRSGARGARGGRGRGQSRGPRGGRSSRGGSRPT